ncbi:hypothetical protein PUNSTDRAFT_140285 [Punctularia strigosozonata HHB-11173 SS5]|uniref:uncharacterized protein n=1 Tax=Punctularia strigosozonata (strain HHB-11173) TaxID=741275 RepID=UPI00044180AC|nr:uncharacterized protein PUNSTDRAFT_140285 [Punctularia strigosozonata HHB-11173 SS5]EIN13838.1 hypothetical protein PUNSTDRAFT_140285 [Punctularia strigosozonata HHB-11173 SS5]
MSAVEEPLGSPQPQPDQPALVPQQLQAQPGDPPNGAPNAAGAPGDGSVLRKPKAPSVRRACLACHTGKTRCSDVLPCQSCLKRGLGATCAYPELDNQEQAATVGQPGAFSAAAAPYGPPLQYPSAPPPPPMQPLTPQGQYYEYSTNTFNAAPSSSNSTPYRPTKRPRPLTEEEAAAITRNFTRGDFFVGNSAPVRIDPRLPVRLTLGEGDSVHFTIGEPFYSQPSS